MKTFRLVAMFLLAFGAMAQKYKGPVPEKEDVLYLVQADNLIVTETLTAKEEKGKKDETTYVLSGAKSSARSPLASPIFLLKAKDLTAEKLQLFKLDVKNGHREITFRSGKRAKNPEPLRINVSRLDEGLYRLEVSDSLPNGEYSITPPDSNLTFCFEVY